MFHVIFRRCLWPVKTHTHTHAYASYSYNAHRSPSWKGRCVRVHLTSCTVYVHIDTSDYSRHTNTFAQAPCMLIYSKHHTVPPGVGASVCTHQCSHCTLNYTYTLVQLHLLNLRTQHTHICHLFCECRCVHIII